LCGRGALVMFDKEEHNAYDQGERSNTNPSAESGFGACAEAAMDGCCWSGCGRKLILQREDSVYNHNNSSPCGSRVGRSKIEHWSCHTRHIIAK